MKKEQKKHEYENINKRTYIQSIHTSTNFGRPDGAPDHVSPTPPQTAHHRDPSPTFPAKNVYTIYDKAETYGHSTEMKKYGYFYSQ